MESNVQDELRRAINALPGLVWSAGADGAVDFLNQRWCDYSGITVDDGRGWGWLHTVHADDRPQLLQSWRALLDLGDAGEAEARLRRADGEFRWFLIRAVPTRGADGAVVKWYCENIDIEDRKRAKALLAGERQLLELVASGTGLSEVLDAVCRFVERSDEHCHCSVLLVDDRGTSVHHRAAPTLPATFTHAVDGRDTARPYWGPCAMAASLKSQVLVPDIADDTRWRDFEWCQLALTHGLRSCWTTPILSKGGDVFGTFAIYRRIPGAPTSQHQELIERLTHIASIAIERGRTAAALQASEERLRLVTDAIPEVIWLTALQPEAVLYTSPSFERVWGLPLSDLYQNPRLWTDAIHTDDRARVTDAFARWITSAGFDDYDIEFRITQPSGAVRWIHERGVMLFDSQGAPSRVGGISTDITDRKHVEEELRRSQAHLAEAQRLSSTGSFTWRVSSGDILWSEQAYRIYEIDPSVPVTFDVVFTRIHPDEATWFQALLERASSEGTDLEFEHRLLLADQTVKHLHVVAHATRDRSGQLEYVGAVQDVTERRRSEDALNALRAELAHISRATTLGALTASIAHEVNQPLSGIITNAHTSLLMLADDPPNVEGAAASAERTIRDANRATQVIARLRALFAKSDRVEESLDLNEATREVLALSRRELERARIALQTDLASDLPLVVGDRVQLQQVVLNLVLNATDAMRLLDRQPRRLLIKTEHDQTSDAVRLLVRDSGPGIAEETMDRLFQPFYTTKPDGMGVGLSISRSIVERHLGTMLVQRHDGAGATFGFSIPRVAALGRALRANDPPVSSAWPGGNSRASR